MTPTYTGPRLARLEDRAACDRLGAICFGGGAAEENETISMLPSGDTYAIFSQDKPVAQIGIFHERLHVNENVIHIGSIGGVCTHPEHRGQGLASQLMETCTQQLVKEKASLMLISGDRGLYLRLGCVPAGLFNRFTLRAGPIRAGLDGLTLRPVTPADAALCSRLYQSEAAHFARPIDRFAEALHDPWSYLLSAGWIVALSGQPVAYFILGLPWEYSDRPEAGVRAITEYAGSRTAIAHALGRLLSQDPVGNHPPLQEIWAQVAWQDVDLTQLLTRLGGEIIPEALFDHTMRLINFPALMTGLRAYVRARLEPKLRRGLTFAQHGPLLGAQGGDACVIARQQDRLELSVADMTRLVMGAPDAPVISAPGALAEVLADLFPLPAFYPGLNYH